MMGHKGGTGRIVHQRSTAVNQRGNIQFPLWKNFEEHVKEKKINEAERRHQEHLSKMPKWMRILDSIIREEENEEET